MAPLGGLPVTLKALVGSFSKERALVHDVIDVIDLSRGQAGWLVLVQFINDYRVICPASAAATINGLRCCLVRVKTN